MLLSDRVRILYDEGHQIVLFLLFFGALPLFFCLFRFIPLFVVLLFRFVKVFILVDEVGDTNGYFVPFQVDADIVFGMLSVRPFHADAFTVMVLTFLSVSVPADPVLVFQEFRIFLDGRIGKVFFVNTILSVLNAAAAQKLAFDELLFAALFLRFEKVEHGHLRLVFPLALADRFFFFLYFRIFLLV